MGVNLIIKIISKRGEKLLKNFQVRVISTCMIGLFQLIRNLMQCHLSREVRLINMIRELEMQLMVQKAVQVTIIKCAWLKSRMLHKTKCPITRILTRQKVSLNWPIILQAISPLPKLCTLAWHLAAHQRASCSKCIKQRPWFAAGAVLKRQPNRQAVPPSFQFRRISCRLWNLPPQLVVGKTMRFPFWLPVRAK